MYNNLNRSDVRDKPFSANFDQIYSYLNYTSNNIGETYIKLTYQIILFGNTD